MARKTKGSIGSRQAVWLLSGGAELFRDPDKNALPVVGLPEWINEPDSEHTSTTPQPTMSVGVVPVSEQLGGAVESTQVYTDIASQP